MTIRRLICTAALLTTACTFDAQEPLKGELHTPLTYRTWSWEPYTSNNGSKACEISSGYNGLTVLIGRKPHGEDVAIKGNHPMMPGTTLTVNAGGGTFETEETYFPKQLAPELLKSLTKGGKVYLEWFEMGGPEPFQRRREQNIIKMDDFAQQLKECRKLLGSAP